MKTKGLLPVEPNSAAPFVIVNRSWDQEENRLRTTASLEAVYFRRRTSSRLRQVQPEDVRHEYEGVAEENAFYNIPEQMITSDFEEIGIYPQWLKTYYRD